MSMLIEKRKEIASKLEGLRITRDEEIQRKLNLYKLELESQPCEEIAKLQHVLNAMDEVIAYELKETEVKPVTQEVTPVTEIKVTEREILKEVAPVTEQIQEAKTESVEFKIVTDVATEEVRPGMSYIGIPERR